MKEVKAVAGSSQRLNDKKQPEHQLICEQLRSEFRLKHQREVKCVLSVFKPCEQQRSVKRSQRKLKDSSYLTDSSLDH